RPAHTSTPSLHDALPISDRLGVPLERQDVGGDPVEEPAVVADDDRAAGEGGERVLQGPQGIDVEVVGRLVEQEHVAGALDQPGQDRKSTRLNSSHVKISY